MVSLAKNMETIIQNFLINAIGKPLWNVRIRLGSMLVFEIGEKVEDDRGEFHFSFDGCHWWLQQGQGRSFNDVVHSESSKENIETQVKILEGKRLLGIQINEEIASAVFDFEGDFFLRVAPYGSTSMLKQWKVFTKDKILTVFSDSRSEVKDLD